MLKLQTKELAILSHEWSRRRIGKFGVNPITSSPKGVAPSNFGC